MKGASRNCGRLILASCRRPETVSVSYNKRSYSALPWGVFARVIRIIQPALVIQEEFVGVLVQSAAVATADPDLRSRDSPLCCINLVTTPVHPV